MIRRSNIPIVALHPASEEYEGIYLSISDAARHLGVSISGISAALYRGDRGAHSCSYGYKWRRATTEEIRTHMRYKCKICGVEGLRWEEMGRQPNYVSGVSNSCKQCVKIRWQINKKIREAKKRRRSNGN